MTENETSGRRQPCDCSSCGKVVSTEDAQALRLVEQIKEELSLLALRIDNVASVDKRLLCCVVVVREGVTQDLWIRETGELAEKKFDEVCFELIPAWGQFTDEQKSTVFDDGYMLFDDGKGSICLCWSNPQ